MGSLRQPLSAADLKLERKAKLLELEVARYGGSTVGLNADGTWEIERVLKKSGKRFLIRWKGWTEEHDSLVSRKALTRATLEEFEEREEIVAARKERKTRPPFTQSLCMNVHSTIHKKRLVFRHQKRCSFLDASWRAMATIVGGYGGRNEGES